MSNTTSTSTSTSILLTGATGYIGGSVLSVLLSSSHPVIQNASISVLVRGEDKARVLAQKTKNNNNNDDDDATIKTILFKGFDDLETIRKAASEHDVVIHTASGFHTQCATSLIKGLAERKQKMPGRHVHYLHTSGTSNLADSPLLNLYPNPPDHVLRDSDPELILSTTKYLNSVRPYPQRTTDLAVVESGLDMGVKTYIFISPMIYGAGAGEFHRLTHQVPEMMRAAVKDGYAWIVGDGKGVKNHVHILDLAGVYEVFLKTILEGNGEVPSGERGIFFTENGEHSFKEVGEGIAKAGKELGLLETDEVKSLSLDEATGKLGWGDQTWTESGFVSSSRTRSDVARSLGWKPKRLPEDFNMHYAEEWKFVMEEEKKSRKNLAIW